MNDVRIKAYESALAEKLTAWRKAWAARMAIIGVPADEIDLGESRKLDQAELDARLQVVTTADMLFEARGILPPRELDAVGTGHESRDLKREG